MNPQEHNMAVLGQIVKLIPKKLIERQFQNSSKLSKRPLLRSDKGSVFPPSHKAAAGQAPVTLQVASANYPLQLFANGIESHFLNDF